MGEKETKWHNGKKEHQTNRGEQHLTHRPEADMQTCCQPHLQEDVHPHPPASGPKASMCPSASGAIARKTQEQSLTTGMKLIHLSEWLIVLGATSFPSTITF